MPGPPAATAPIDIRNRMPIAGWVFIGIFLGFNAIFTYILGRDGPPPSAPGPIMHLVLGGFWVVGVAVAGQLLSIPVTRLTETPDGGLQLVSRTPLRRRVEHFPPGAIADIRLARDRDSDGDPYWRVELVLADGSRRAIREGHDEAGLAALADRLHMRWGRG